MTDLNLRMHIDLAGIAGRVQRLLKRANYLVAIGMRAESQIDENSFRLPEIPFVHEYDHTNPWSVDEAKPEWTKWILANGFREVAEATAGTLEEAQSVLAVWSVITPDGQSTRIKADEWNLRVAKRAEQFHRRTLPQKLEFLANHYDFNLAADFISEAMSVNAARNCLVHRGGVVNSVDADESGVLVLRWRALRPFALEDGLEQEVSL
ncbi:MAG: hypothetical protein ABW190_02730, partial [Rhizobacter sp.]